MFKTQSLTKDLSTFPTFRLLLVSFILEMSWYIKSFEKDSIRKLLPLLIAKDTENSFNFYFDHLELRFYDIQSASGISFISTNDYFLETELEHFYSQTTDNTTYIIHPDEILAENFVLAVLAQENPAILDNLSKEGKQLVLDLIVLLAEN